MSDKVPANTLEFSHKQKLENIQKKIDELNKMKHILQNAKENKQSESYLRLFSENIDYLKRERGKTRTTTWNLPGPSGTRNCIDIIYLSHPSPLLCGG